MSGQRELVDSHQKSSKSAFLGGCAHVGQRRCLLGMSDEYQDNFLVNTY